MTRKCTFKLFKQVKVQIKRLENEFKHAKKKQKRSKKK